MAATACGTTPSVQAKAASTPARAPRVRPAAMEYNAPVPGLTR